MAKSLDVLVVESHPHAAGTAVVVGACVRPSTHAFDPLRRDIASRIAALLVAAGVDPGAVECRIEADGPRLHVRLVGPTVSRRVEQALGVRVLDAVRPSRRTFGEVNVSYHTTTGGSDR